MRLEQLEYFVSAVSLQSLNAVSEAFYISPQVVSKAIKQLEEELRTPLFVRSRKGLLLTEKGKDVYHYALEIVNNVHYLRAHYSNPCADAPPFAHDIAILTAKGLLPIFQSLLDHASTPKSAEMKLTLHTGHSYSIAETLTDQTDYDLIGIAYPKQDWPALSQKMPAKLYSVYLLKEETLKVFMNRNSPLSRQKEISLKKLSSIPFIKYSIEPDMLFDHYLKETYHIKPKYSAYVDNISVCLDMIQEDHGYALGLDGIFFGSLSPEQRTKIISIPLSIDYRYYCLLLVKKEKAEEASIRAFVCDLVNRLNATLLL